MLGRMLCGDASSDKTRELPLGLLWLVDRKLHVHGKSSKGRSHTRAFICSPFLLPLTSLSDIMIIFHIFKAFLPLEHPAVLYQTRGIRHSFGGYKSDKVPRCCAKKRDVSHAATSHYFLR